MAASKELMDKVAEVTAARAERRAAAETYAESAKELNNLLTQALFAGGVKEGFANDVFGDGTVKPLDEVLANAPPELALQKIKVKALPGVVTAEEFEEKSK